jgi:hypothetical protein
MQYYLVLRYIAKNYRMWHTADLHIASAVTRLSTRDL